MKNDYESQLLDLIKNSKDPEAAILIALEVIHAELERLLSAQSSPPANPPAEAEKG